MKKIGLGISVLLFAALPANCSDGMELLALGIGIAGLVISAVGFAEKNG